MLILRFLDNPRILRRLFMMYISFILLLTYFTENHAFCWWNQCCLEPDSIIRDLEANLTQSLFGQHLVIEPILTTLASHLKYEPTKALVLSFHGPSGVGKSFIAKMIAHHLFNGMTYYVKFYSGVSDFADSSYASQHKEKLIRDISDTTSKCGHSIFIFDEAQSMTDSLFDTIRPFVEHYNEFKGIDYRRTIFIFISNAGASEISDIYYNKKVNRENLVLNDFEQALVMALFNTKGGFKESILVKNFLVDYYIPFLPLEEEHIKLCIHKALQEKKVEPDVSTIRNIYDLLPKRMKGNIEYIPSNCKKVNTEVGKYIMSQKSKYLKSRATNEL